MIMFSNNLMNSLYLQNKVFFYILEMIEKMKVYNEYKNNKNTYNITDYSKKTD